MVKNLPAMRETWIRFLGWEDSPGAGSGNPFQYSCLENPMDRGAWWAIACGLAKNWIQLSDTFTHLLILDYLDSNLSYLLLVAL